MTVRLAILSCAVLACGCGVPAKPASQPVDPEEKLPALALEYLDGLCSKGDAESCEVLDTLEAMRILCESGDPSGCQGLDEMAAALDGLDRALAEEMCMDPCSEECMQTCASSADGETGDCLDGCMSSCLAKGCP